MDKKQLMELIRQSANEWRAAARQHEKTGNMSACGAHHLAAEALLEVYRRAGGKTGDEDRVK